MIIKGKDYRLPKRFKAKWIKALRSGKYNQGANKLYKIDAHTKEEKYCCLGVAGNICGIPNSSLEGEGCYNEYNKNATRAAKKYEIPNLLITNNKNSDEPECIIVGKLIEKNDSGRWSFNRIASYIEKYL